MHSLPSQQLPILAPAAAQRGAISHWWGALVSSPDEVFGRHTALLAGLLGFFAFLPYPALNVGSTSAIQIGNVFVLILCAPIVAMSWRSRPYWILPAILAPLIVSCTSVAMLG